jgi:copper chaperone
MQNYSVAGMTCEHCAASVTKAIKKSDPGAVVKADVANATVAVDSALDDEGICAAIRAAGYESRAVT